MVRENAKGEDMTIVPINKTYLEGRIKVGFNDQGLRLISFRQFGIKEEGLALVFKQKEVTGKSIQRIKGLVRDFENAQKSFADNPKRAELIDQMEHLMKKLCGKIGQLETLTITEGNSEEIALAKKALHLIEKNCGVAVFQQRAERILQVPTQRAGGLFC